MRISEVKYMRRFNLGNYEHEELALTAVLEEDEDHKDAIAALKVDIASASSGAVAASSSEKEETPAPKKGKKGKPEPEEEEVDEDAETLADEETEEEAEEEEEEAEEAEEAEEEEEEEKPKSKKNFKKKPQAYSRKSEQHKNIFSSILLSVAPDWKKNDESKAKGKSASVKMEGKDFLDESGEVLPEFKAELKKFMSSKKK